MLVIASDHAGYALKQELMEHLKARGTAFGDVFPGELPLSHLCGKGRPGRGRGKV